ncbi:uncharacterized protein LOC119646722 isoform X2 [Hermetia illucens]|uniref:uncharacterized protein LOC119646722 isoform X2 n=1 Tax=Hermetia illucens TaxID=343691 RepID=UPI0018CC2291|nr:uncharacterized protein LOC119646722 isoform X2 [Hermetia illucens]
MKYIAFVSVCYLVAVTTSILAIPIDQQSDIHHRNVRDLFVTTGWGGAGLPYSTFYITGKQLKEIRSETNSENKKRNVDHNPEIISLVECLECDGKMTATQEKKKNERRTVPQLFSSSGWGPLGRRRR